MRNLSRSGRELLQELEGLELEAYQDQAGVWTIGYGHTGGVYKGQKITGREAAALLTKDVRWAEEAVDQAAPMDLPQDCFDAFVIFTFNVGAAGFRQSTALKRARAGRLEDVPEALAWWNKVTVNGRKVVSRGLVNRRAAEAALWTEGLELRVGGPGVQGGKIARPEPPALKPLRKSKEATGSIAGVFTSIAGLGGVFSALGDLPPMVATALIVALGACLLAFVFLYGNRLVARLQGER